MIFHLNINMIFHLFIDSYISKKMIKLKFMFQWISNKILSIKKNSYLIKKILFL